MCKVWALSRSLAATEEVAVAFFSSRYLDVSVPWVCSPTLCIQIGVTRYDPRRVAPFGNPRIKAWLAAPRGLSQLPHVLLRLLKPRHPPDTLSSLGNILILIAAALPRILGQCTYLFKDMCAVLGLLDCQRSGPRHRPLKAAAQGDRFGSSARGYVKLASSARSSPNSYQLFPTGRVGFDESRSKVFPLERR